MLASSVSCRSPGEEQEHPPRQVVEFEREFVCERTESGRLTFGDIHHRDR